MKKALLFFLVLILLIVGCTQQPPARPVQSNDNSRIAEADGSTVIADDQPSDQPDVSANSGSGDQPEIVDSGDGQNDVTFDITAKSWEFTPNEIKVKQGDHVILKVTSIDKKHGFAIDEYGINEPLMPNQETEIEFTADKKGTFEFYCNVPCGKGHGGMQGQLIVE